MEADARHENSLVLFIGVQNLVAHWAGPHTAFYVHDREKYLFRRNVCIIKS
jgi:hypothetical protein